VKPDGSAGTITKLKTSRPLYHSDGLRAYGPDRLIEVEGATKGNLDLITVSGDDAKVETIKSGFEGPVSLWQVGDAIYGLDTAKLSLRPEEEDTKAARVHRLLRAGAAITASPPCPCQIG
jgi:hypothetical protein